MFAAHPAGNMRANATLPFAVEMASTSKVDAIFFLPSQARIGIRAGPYADVGVVVMGRKASADDISWAARRPERYAP